MVEVEGPMRLSMSSSKSSIGFTSFFFMPVTMAGTELLFMGLTAPPTATGGGALIKSRKLDLGCYETGFALIIMPGGPEKFDPP